MKRHRGSSIGSNGDTTDKLQPTSQQALANLETDLPYVRIGDNSPGTNGHDRPRWRVLFELASNPSVRFGLEIVGEVIIGRGQDRPNLVDLSRYDAVEYGVSRQHLLLRPSPTKLFVIDLGSTNGTLRNGHSIGVNTPYNLVDGDTLSLGRFHLVVRIVDRPKGRTAQLRQQADFGDALVEIADSITSQLEIDEVLNRITETSMTLTSAGEVGVWLVDEKSGELFLEAQRGIEDERIKRIRLPIKSDSPVTEVIRTGKPLRAHREPGGELIKVKTNYLLESIVYVPLTLGGITFGVLSAAHREPGKQFDERDERFLGVIAHFAAIALQNARLFHVTDAALEKRANELATLNELTQAVSASLDLEVVHQVLMDQINRYWQVDSCGLWLVSENQQATLMTAPGSKLLPDSDFAVSAIERLVHEVASSGQPILANDVQPGSRQENEKHATIMVAGSAVCVPLTVQQRVVGVLALFKKGRARFAEEDLNRLQAFAHPVATAIQNASLFDESERERATIRATARVLPQPLFIVGESGQAMITNNAADSLLQTDMSQVFDGIRDALGHTRHVTIAGHTYVATAEHQSGVGTIAVMQDVTDFVQAEEALRESEERYRTLVETSPDAITLTDLDGKVIVCNHQAAVLYGFDSPRDAIGADSFAFIAAEDRDRAAENLIKIVEIGTLRNIGYTLLRKDGTRFPAELSASLLRDRDQKPQALIDIVRDITHIKLLEETRSDFVHALSHDLKSPLSSIKGWAQLLQNDHSLNDQAGRFVNRIVGASDSAINMIERLLDIASITEVPRLRLSPCVMNELVEQAMSDLDGAAQVKSLTMDLKIVGKPHVILGDRQRLYQSVLNLLDNAIKYSATKTSILITLDFAHSAVTLKITDGGPGIPEADIPHIFDKYYRGETAQNGKGVGLGLATVKAAVEAHNGKVVAQNVKGGGAEFMITLPATPAVQPSLGLLQS